jgi:ParB family transcriptional regulator, chromosome partitioning protein
MKKSALGRGLEALIPNKDISALSHSVSLKERIVHLPLEKIAANPVQPRENFDRAKLEELKSSIVTHGVLSPILVREESGGFQVIAGERRLRASREIGLETVPAILKAVDDTEMLELALVENIQRDDLNPIEQARAYELLMKEANLIQEDLAVRVGKDRSTVSNTLRLLTLPNTVQNMLYSGALSTGHAKLLLSLKKPSEQKRLAELMAERGLSVREAEAYLRRLKTQAEKKKGQAEARDPDIVSLEEQLSRTLGCKVNIRFSGRRGSISIPFKSLEHFDSIVSKIC